MMERKKRWSEEPLREGLVLELKELPEGEAEPLGKLFKGHDRYPFLGDIELEVADMLAAYE